MRGCGAIGRFGYLQQMGDGTYYSLLDTAYGLPLGTVRRSVIKTSHLMGRLGPEFRSWWAFEP